MLSLANPYEMCEVLVSNGTNVNWINKQTVQQYYITQLKSVTSRQ